MSSCLISSINAGAWLSKWKKSGRVIPRYWQTAFNIGSEGMLLFFNKKLNSG